MTAGVHLPANLDAEEQVLGAILARGAMPGETAVLAPEDFYIEKHARLFDVLKGMAARGEATDVISVNAKLNGTGGLWVRDLAAGALAIPAATPQHVALVREAAERRRAVFAAQRVIESGGDLTAIRSIPVEISSRRLGALSRSDSYDLIGSHPPRWRVNGILSTDDQGTLAGPKGVGKTFAMGDMGVSVSLGEPWFGRFETEQARVLFLTSEDSRARLWRRADAIARSRDRDPDELDGVLFIHPLSFSAVTDLDRLQAELEAVEPGLVLLDPAYRYMYGVRAQLFDMGAVLTPLGEACSAVGAPLVVGHHYNRREGSEREERLSGAGLLEWARVVITAEARPRRDAADDVVVSFEITGNSIDPVSFNVRRRVEAFDDSPDPELRYEVEVLAEGAEARTARYMKARERVLAVLPNRVEDAVLVSEIGDLVAHDATGKGGLKHGTIHKVLSRDLADEVDSTGGRMDMRWWRS